MLRGIDKARSRGLAPRQSTRRVGSSGAARGTPGCPQLCSSEDPRVGDVDPPRVGDVDPPRVGDPVTLEEFGRELKGMWASTEISAAFTVTKMQQTRGDQDFEHGSLKDASKVMTDTCGALRKRRLITKRRTFAELRRTYVR